MNRQWVINSSPLIILAKISQLSMFLELGGEIVIPEGVAREIRQGPIEDKARFWLIREGQPWVKDIGEVDPVIAAWDLGIGESQVLSWAYKRVGFEAILDDRSARNCALSLGIPVRGTLGVILLAKKEGRLSEIEPIFNQLTEAGFRIEPQIMKALLQLAGEI